MNFFKEKLGIDDVTINKLLLLIFHSFFSGIFVSIYFSIANVEFVTNFGSGSLPFGYLLSGIIGFLMVQGYRRLLKKGGFKGFVGSILFLLICTIFFRLALLLPQEGITKSMSFVIFLFAMPFLSLSWLQQSGLLMRTMEFSNTKKFAGLVNSGATIASIIGYLTVPAVVPYLKSPFDMLEVAIIGLLIALFFLYKLKKHIDVEVITSFNKNVYTNEVKLKTLLQQPFIRSIAICGGISMSAFYFIDFTFLINIKTEASSTIELARILSLFFAAIKTIELILSLLSARIFRIFGLKSGIVILPIFCFSLTLAGFFSYHLASHFIFIIAILTLKLSERSINKAIEESAYKNLYQLLPIADRLVIQARIDGGTKQLFIVLASLILIIYTSIVKAEYLKVGLIYFTIPLFAFWLFSSLKLVVNFKQRLLQILEPSDENHKNQSKTPNSKIKSILKELKSGASPQSTLQVLLSQKFKLSGFNPSYLNMSQREVNTKKPIDKEHLNNQNPILEKFEINLEAPILIFPININTNNSNENTAAETIFEQDLINLTTAENSSLTEDVLKHLLIKLSEVKSEYQIKFILNLLENSRLNVSKEFLINQLEFPNYYVKKQIYRALENIGYKCPQNNELKYRKALESTLIEISFVICMLASIPLNDNFKDIIAALKEEESLLKKRLLSILTWKYDDTSIKVVSDAIFAKKTNLSITNNALALELIEVLIDSDIKPKIVSALETDSYSKRLAKLNKWYYQPEQNTEKALESILNYDYTKLGIWTKACALKKLVDENNSAHKNIIAGFSFHSNSFLRNISFEYKDKKDGVIVYPLPTTENQFYKFHKNESFETKGTELFNLLKKMKEHDFFKKLSSNDLTKIIDTIDIKSQNIIQFDNKINQKSKAYFITEGKLLIEYVGEFPKHIFTKNFIGQLMFGEQKIYKVTVSTNDLIFEIPQTELTNLILSSETLTNYLERRKF